MKMEIKNENVNRLLHRTELTCAIDTEGSTPSRKDLIKQVAAKKGVNENIVVVDDIKQEFGKKVATAYVKIYESEKAAQSVERQYQLDRAKTAITGEKVKKKKKE